MVGQKHIPHEDGLVEQALLFVQESHRLLKELEEKYDMVYAFVNPEYRVVFRQGYGKIITKEQFSEEWVEVLRLADEY